MILLYFSDTNRPLDEDEQNGETFWHLTEDEIIQDIASNKFIEYGQYESHYYGKNLFFRNLK